MSVPRATIVWAALAGVLALSCTGKSGGRQAGHRAQATPDGASVATAPTEEVATAPANGWGDHIAWRHLDEGLAEAERSGRPLMLVVHASWCSQCKRLKPAFKDKELSELAHHFVMVNADQDEVTKVNEYGPDGRYLPRVVFLSPSGELDASLSNPKRGQQRYYYGPRDDLVGTMRKALDAHGKT